MNSYSQSFTNAASWIVTHNLNDMNVAVDVWLTISVSSSEKAYPYTFTVVDANTVNITWTSARSGGVRVVSTTDKPIQMDSADPGNQPPTAVIDIPTSPVTIAESQSVNFTGTGEDPALQPLDFLWKFAGGVGNTSVPDPGNVTFNTAGTYIVTFSVNNGAWTIRDTRTVTVTPTAFQGTVWGWGANSHGQLATNDTTDRSSPVQTVAGGTDWKQLSAGWNGGRGIKTDGTLWTWGFNMAGQLGTNDTTFHSSPVQTAAGGTNWKQVSSGYYHTAAIKTDGTLWTWGDNFAGGLGTNDVNNHSSPVQTVASGANWSAISVGNSHTAAIKTDGTLWMWGGNFGGQLGTNDVDNRSSPVQTVAGGTNWRHVSCGYDTTCAIKTDGTLWVWGDNWAGGLGTNDRNRRSSPVQTVTGGTNWVHVNAGFGGPTFAIKGDGTLWGWGDNWAGALGTNDTDRRSSPVQTIAGGTNWKQVAVGTLETAAIKTDGTLWTWGYNDGGELGTGDTVSRSSPVQTVAGGTSWKQVVAGDMIMLAIKEYVLAPPPPSFSLTHQTLNSFIVQNTGLTSMKITQVSSNPPELMVAMAGMLRGSANSDFTSPFSDFYAHPATMSVTVAAGMSYYFQFTYSWNTGDTATVTCTNLDDTGTTQQTITR